MAKLCIYEGCKNKQFGGGYCTWHQRMRKEIVRKTVVRKSIRKVSRKQSKRLNEKVYIRKIDHELYKEIWEEREHRDFETGEPIIEELSTLLFHHVLPKRPKEQGGYPEFRHCKWNIVIVSWATHQKAEADIDLVPKIKEYRDYLLKTYVK